MSSSCRELTLLVEWKQTNLVDEIITLENTSTEAMPGQYVNSIFSANSRSERQSFQCLHLRQGRCKRNVTTCRKRDREPSRLPCEVLKLVKRRKVRGRIKHFLKKSVPVSSVALLGGIINVIQNFCSGCLIITTTSCQKRSFCYLEALN